MRTCHPCHAIRDWKQQEDERLELIRWLFRQLTHALGRNRLGQPHARRMLATLTQLCGGRAEDFAREWKRLVDEETYRHPGSAFVANLLLLPLSLSLLPDPPAEADEGSDLSRLSDAELEAEIRLELEGMTKWRRRAVVRTFGLDLKELASGTGT